VRRLLFLSALLLTMNVLPGLAAGQTVATTNVTANPTTITVGNSVGLAATVQPNSAPSAGTTIPRPSGTITFLDGTTPLSGAPIALAPNSYTSATFPQTFGTPDPTLTVYGEVVGDLNGDGVQDLLIYGTPAPFSMQTFTSNGKGGYNASAVQTAGFPAGCTASNGAPQLIDLNGDGKPDILCGSLVAYGNGDGTFAQAVSVSFLASGFITTYAADLNGDGKTDILAVPSSGTPSQSSGGQFAVTVFLNQGGGSFASSGTFPVAPATYEFQTALITAPILVDLNGDGKLDLITQLWVTQLGSGGFGLQTVDVLLNQGDGTFGAYTPVTIASGPNIGPGGLFPLGMASGDVNGDGKQDLILTVSDNDANLDAIVLLGNGDGTFQPATYFIVHQLENAQGNPWFQTPSVVVEDLNLDGKQDLIFGDGQVGLGNGDGTFILSSPLFQLQVVDNYSSYAAFPLAPITLPGNLVPSLVYSLPTDPPPVYTLPPDPPPSGSVFTPQTSSSGALSLTTLAVGTHTITARYSGDANYGGDTSAAVTVTVNQAVPTGPTLTLSPSSITFPGQYVGTSGLPLTVTATNSGSAPLTITSATTSSNNFGVLNTCGGSLAAGSSCAIGVFFDPSSSGAVSGTLTVANDVGGSPQTIALSGSGQDFSFTSSSSTQTVTPGSTATYTVAVNPIAGFNQMVTMSCSGAPAGSTCSLSPSSIALSGSTPASVTVSVTTMGNSAVAAQPGSPHGPQVPIFFAICGLPGLLLLGGGRSALCRGKSAAIYGVALLGIVCFVMAGCGGNSSGTGGGGTPANTYTLTVTGTFASGSANLTHSTNLTMVVQ
jgi:hypothetical protein